MLEEKRAHYKSIKDCWCPILKERIIFNSKGFHHLRYNGAGHKRSVKEQMYRIGLIPLIKPVIKNATKIHKYTPKTYSKSLGKYVEYWLLRDIVGKQDTIVDVILRRIGDGNITFYSVWKKATKNKKTSF